MKTTYKILDSRYVGYCLGSDTRFKVAPVIEIKTWWFKSTIVVYKFAVVQPERRFEHTGIAYIWVIKRVFDTSTEAQAWVEEIEELNN
jgi:hypothetical protein